MTWVALVIVAIILIAMSMYYPRTAFGLLGTLLVAGVIVYRLTGTNEGSRPIAAEQLQLQNLHMKKSYADSYDLIGRIRNNADRSLREFSVLVQALDCPETTDRKNCSIVGEKNVSVYLQVPPQQARDFRENVYFGQIQPVGSLQWRYQLY